MSVGDGVQLDVIGTLLHMRGANPTPQPLRGNPNFSSTGDAMTESGDNLFLWNGNIFGGDLQVNRTHVISRPLPVCQCCTLNWVWPGDRVRLWYVAMCLAHFDS